MNIDWATLGFAFRPTKSNIRFTYADGKWDDGKLHSDYTINMSIAANALHYGQAIFEGMKAFRCKDGKVRIFRPDANARRINESAKRLLMPEFPVEKFVEAVRTVVRDNLEFVPPYGTGGSLYIRPVMFGTTPQVGVGPSKEYVLAIMVMPVGAYYKGGVKPVDAMVSVDYDRAAPLGTGHIKCAGNYAASLVSSKQAHDNGCAVALFLDPATRTSIDEFGTSNFLAITGDNKYVTPLSNSALPSITNNSLMTLAADLGMKVEQRKVGVEELADFAEIAACGTAVVITPIHHLYYGAKTYTYPEQIGATLKKLYEQMTGIQYGEKEDLHNWMVEA